MRKCPLSPPDAHAENSKLITNPQTRIGMAKNAFNQRKELLSKTLNKDIKKRIIIAIVWSVALYPAETSTYRKEDIRRLETFEMLVWRRMEMVSWRDMKINEEVLQLVQEKEAYGCDLEK